MSKINDDIQADKLYEFKDIETEQHTKPNFIRKLLSLNSKFPSFASNDELITNDASNEITEQTLTNDLLDSDSVSSNKSSVVKEDSPKPLSTNNKYTLTSLLKQVYDIRYLQGNSNGGGPSKEFWMPDDQVKECFNCNEKFTVYKRRHVNSELNLKKVFHIVQELGFLFFKHCRVCGQIFCNKCSDYEIQAQLVWQNQNGKIRVCTFCYGLVSQFENGNDLSNKNSIKELMKRVAVSPSSLQSTKKNSEIETTSSSTSHGLTTNPSIQSNPFDVDELKDYLRQQENEITKLITSNVSELRNLWIQLYHTSDGIQFTTKNMNKFKKISNCITSTELIEWLIKKKSVTKDQAIVIGQALVHGKWLECANSSSNSEQIFSEALAYYRPGPSAIHAKAIENKTKTNTSENKAEEPEWIDDLNQMINQMDDDQMAQSILNLNSASPLTLNSSQKVDQNEYDEDSTRKQLNNELKAFKIDSIASKFDYEAEMLKFNPIEDLQEIHKKHQMRLLEQLLKFYDLSNDWFDIILRLANKAVYLVKPDVKHDNDHMDIRTYIKIKKIPNGSKSDCRIVNGIVFTKNVAHKEMQKEFKNPKILLLRSSIEYQRIEEKLCSLEPLLTAESQFLKNNCSKLLKMSPDILVVEKSVSRLAQEFLLQSGIILILNIKSSVMDKLCRFLQADPMIAIDDVKKPRLGYCVDFHVDFINNKTLMFFEGTPTNLGCTILLSGANEDELEIIKYITYFMINVCYNSKLEQSFLIDKSAFCLKVDEVKSNEIDENMSNDSNGIVNEFSFKKALEEFILSSSPFIKFNLPFLIDSTINSKCSLLKYLPTSCFKNLTSNLIAYKKLQLVRKKKKQLNNDDYSFNPIKNWPNDFKKYFNSQHEYLKIHITKPTDDLDIKVTLSFVASKENILNYIILLKKLYADYRSRGQRVMVKQKPIDQAELIKLQSSITNHIDCFDTINRQNLCVLFYSQCESSPVYPNLCIKPRIIRLKFYSENDMTLGSFLTRNCFRSFYMCTNDMCNTLILQHTRYFVHNDAQISIKMSMLNDETSSNPTSVILPSEDSENLQKFDDINIFMWNVCKICKKSTRKVIMSPHTWSFSFGKFLEMTFYAHEYLSLQLPSKSSSRQDDLICVHSLFHGYDQYFRFKNMQTIFSYSKIQIKQLYLPLTELKAQAHLKYRINYIDEIKDLSEKGLTLFSTLIDRLNNLKGPTLNDKQNQKLDQFLQQLNNDTTLKQKIEKINLLLTNFNLKEKENRTSSIDYDTIDLLMIDLKKYIAYSINNWNTKMSDFYKKSKHDETQSIAHENEASLESKRLSSQKDDEINTEIPTNDQSLASKSSSSDLADEDSSKPTSFKRIITNLLTTQTFTPLKLPFPDEEHYILSGESDYYVNDKDLITIIAYTLSSREYKDFQSNKTKYSEIAAKNKEYFAQLNEAEDVDGQKLENNKSLESDAHFDFQFQNTSAKFYCKVYHAELFHQLRQLLFPNDEERYIHSLFRCVNWDAKGGKSNSQFRKTLDNRFIIKEMSSREVHSFVDFIPKYVKYITDCLKNKRATALTKIVGAYRIYMLKNSTLTSNRAVKIDVIVLENLFYRKNCTQVFDLKGSERNRLINTQGKQSEKELVLLDENFLRWSFDNPTYIRCHEKYVLMKAIESDSEFLSSEFVMDYSLLCGYDNVNNEIVIGIIDYIRTFTWDKKLETYIKMIGGKRMPTIVSPEVYRTRFVNAIDRYFLEVPDHWYQDPKELL